MENILSIKIMKNKSEFVFYHENEAVTPREIIYLMNKMGAALAHIAVSENNKLILEIYLPFHSERSFLSSLHKAAKGQVKF